MSESCGDNRLEIIEIAKDALLCETNIEASPKEMECLDAFLYRCWQMGWLDIYDYTGVSCNEKSVGLAREIEKKLEKDQKENETFWATEGYCNYIDDICTYDGFCEDCPDIILKVEGDNMVSDFYNEVVNKTKQANDPDKLVYDLYDAIKIRIEDAAEDGLDNCYVEPNWKYNQDCLMEVMTWFEDDGFTIKWNGKGYSINWEGGNGTYSEEQEIMKNRED